MIFTERAFATYKYHILIIINLKSRCYNVPINLSRKRFAICSTKFGGLAVYMLARNILIAQIRFC